MYKSFMITTLCAGAALGQTVMPGTAGGPNSLAFIPELPEPGRIQVVTALAGKMETVAGAPYSAQTVTERTQTLADGNRIVQTVSGSIARDNQGRTRREESLPGLSAGNSSMPQIVMIDDPVAQVHWTLDGNSKTAIKMSTSGLSGKQMAESRAVRIGGGGPITVFNRMAIDSPEANKMEIVRKDSAESDVRRTDLGTQTIEGVAAHGTRTAFTIPAGKIGNDAPIVITTESWFSPDLKVVVMSKSNDPRMGETDYRLTGIQRGEPAATLFQVPDDYTVKDRPNEAVNYTVVK